MLEKMNKIFQLVIIAFIAFEVNTLTNAQENQIKVKVQTSKQERCLNMCMTMKSCFYLLQNSRFPANF